MNDTAVEAKGLYKIYKTGGKEVKALNGVSIDVKYGEVVSLLGPNGAGKTTLVKILATLLVPDDGQARVGGYDVLTQGHKVRKIIGYAGQDSERSAYFRLTARENLLFFARAFHGISKEEANKRIEELATAFGFESKLDSYFIALSGGEKQTFVIIRSLITKPKIVFMDEPSKSLDPVTASRVRKYIKEYAKNFNAALLVTTHNMLEAEEISNKVVMINKGKILFNGTSEEMKSFVARTESIEIHKNNIEEEIKLQIIHVPGIISAVEKDSGISLVCKDAYEVLPSILGILKSNGRRLPISVGSTTLEEAFKVIVGGDKEN
ncbi:MAG: ABC transporter ATP-binding protein [Candidatus Brockarchaeota archaeon]|nr:ABC transporter ATP-binding protein [Candidatus Brockarchaeota archaeon]MBO3767918.1 ABC transporter ATP-binding protein [Candidatus Brockarchaeota archaeon]